MTMAVLRCAIYTRKSTDDGLDMEFNSLDAQREACAAYIASQRHEGWRALPDRFDDGGYSGGDMERPALKRLLEAVQERCVDVIVSDKESAFTATSSVKRARYRLRTVRSVDFNRRLTRSVVQYDRSRSDGILELSH